MMHPSQCNQYVAGRQHRQQLCWVGARWCHRHVHTPVGAALATPAQIGSRLLVSHCMAFGCMLGLSVSDWRCWLRCCGHTPIVGAGLPVSTAAATAGATAAAAAAAATPGTPSNLVPAVRTLVQKAFEGGETLSNCSACCFLLSSATLDSCLVIANKASTVHSRPVTLITIAVRLRFGVTLKGNVGRFSWIAPFCSALWDLCLSMFGVVKVACCSG
jgi:hypothetical protein